jgi:circadian clock protein KaiB
MNTTTEGPGAEEGSKKTFFRFRLFVAGDEPNSRKARETLNRLAEAYLKDRCDIVVVDVLKDYAAGLAHRVVAVPTLIIEAPPPEQVIVGSLSDGDQVLAVLGLSRNGDAR